MKSTRSKKIEPRRYIGLELLGAKNQKTALAVLEYYPQERKIFLTDIYDRVIHAENQSSDEALLELIAEVNVGVACIGVNVALDLPPCMTCSRIECPMPSKCNVPEVKWMREITEKAERAHSESSVEIRAKEFTPYTQRPVELWARYHIMPKLSPTQRFDIDETLGGNRAPLTARLHFLQRHLGKTPLVEVWPKLSVALLSQRKEFDPHWIQNYRNLEYGAHARQEIIEAFSEAFGVFIYDRDVKKLSQSLTAFDAFFCAYTAMLSDLDVCATSPRGFPTESGWIAYPRKSSGSEDADS